MLKRVGVVAMILGVSACNHSRGSRPVDGGASDGVPGQDGSAPLTPGPDLALEQGVQSVRFTVSYGECAGFCTRSWLVSAGGATLRSSTNLPDDAHTFEETLALDPGVTGKILEAAAQALANPWERRYGCPDCADQGAYHLEVTANGTVRETVLDPDQHPASFDPLIAALQPVREAHPGPTSICVLAPGDCSPGKVSLVLSLNADGTLKPTWYNDLDNSIFLPGCETVTFERVENGAVTWSGHAAVCIWEGTARVLGFTDLFSDFALNAEDRLGTYRVTGTYYEGCTPDKPISQAGCTAQTPVISNSISVTK